jgi:hypothetical protein
MWLGQDKEQARQVHHSAVMDVDGMFNGSQLSGEPLAVNGSAG